MKKFITVIVAFTGIVFTSTTFAAHGYESSRNGKKIGVSVIEAGPIKVGIFGKVETYSEKRSGCYETPRQRPMVSCGSCHSRHQRHMTCRPPRPRCDDGYRYERRHSSYSRETYHGTNRPRYQPRYKDYVPAGAPPPRPRR